MNNSLLIFYYLLKPMEDKYMDYCIEKFDIIINDAIYLGYRVKNVTAS